MIGAKLSNRFEILGELGRGGMGAVYLAHDPLLDRKVAVKLIPPHMLRPEAAERFRREARVIAKMDHPGIVIVHDIGEHEGALFFVMPLLPGRNLREFLRDHILTLDDVLEIAIQVADALDYSHEHGVTHRDIKPENIMVTRERNEGTRVRVTDFGLATASTEHRLTASDALIGTVAYLSPEQVTHDEVDARSDIYSLGTILYECIVGQTPFTGEVAGVLYRIIHELPLSPRTVGVDIPESLDAVIVRCLEKDPNNRPQRARELAEALAACKGSLQADMRTAEVGATTPTLRYDRPTVAPFVGREKEFAELQRKFNAALTGECQFVVISGEAGTGKSRLTEELEKLARARKINVLHGRFLDHDRGFPYQGFCEAIQEYFRARSAPSYTAADFSDLAYDLVALFPVLAEIEELRSASADSTRAVSASSAARKIDDRTHIFELISRALTRIAGGKPLVLILEDLHAADVSVDALQYVVRRLGPTPTMITATFLTTEVDKSHALVKMLNSFKGDRRFFQVHLNPFSPVEHRAFLELTIGSDRLDDGFVRRIYEATEGNPYFTKELVRSMVDSGAVTKNDTGSWTLSSEMGLFSDALPATIQQAVETRIERLPEDLRDVLSIASILGKTFEFRDLTMLAGDPDSLEDSVDQLVSAGFIEEERESRGDRLRFSSGIVRDVLYGALPRRRRRSLHRNYATHLETRNAVRLDPVLASLVHHYSQADIPEKVVEYGIRLAQKSLEAFSAEDAIYAAKTVIDALEENPAVEAEAGTLLAQAYRMAGNIDAAIKEFDRAIKVVERSSDQSKLVATIKLAAEAAWEGRKIDEARRWIDKGLEAARSSLESESLARLLSLGATVANLRGEHRRAKEYLDEIEDLRPVSKEMEIEIPRGGKLLVGLSHTIQAGHPADIKTAEEGEVLTSVFETLVTTDAQGSVVPSLCERWEVLEEGRSFVFDLRKGVIMHDGRELLAEDVVRSFENGVKRSPATLAAAHAAIDGAANFFHGFAEKIDGLVLLGPHKLLVQLAEPLPLYPALLTDARTGILKENLEGSGARTRLVGTGPFKLSTLQPDRVVLQRHNEYWKGGTFPFLESVEFRAGKSAAEIASAFRAGELDIARDLLPDDLEEILRDRQLRASLVEAPKKNTYFVLFNQSGKLARHPRVLEALCGLVRTHDLVRRTLGRLAQPAEGLLPPGILGHNPGRRRPMMSRDAAGDVIHQARLDRPVRLTAAVHPILQDRYGQLTNALLEVWSDLGIEISIATSNVASYLERWEHNEGIDLLIGRHIADYDDPDNFTYGLFHSTMGAFRRYYSSPELDELIEHARIVSVPGQREKIYRRAENCVMESNCFLPLFHEIDYRVAGPKVRGLVLRSSPPYVNYADLAKVEIAAPPAVLKNRGGTIHVPIGQQLRSLDPSLVYRKWEDEVIPAIFETLTRVVEGARIVPWLASHFEAEDGGNRFRFHLREDVRFHHGRRLTARDVRYSFEHLLQNRESQSRWLLSPIKGAEAMLNGQAGELEGFRIVSSSEFVLELDKPVSFFPSVLANTPAAIVPEGSDQFNTNWREGCAGTGPFRVARFDANRRLELEANPYYWRPGYPKSDNLIFTFAASPPEILAKFRSGRFSLARDLFPADVKALRQDFEIGAKYGETPSLSTYIVAFNTQRGPLADDRLRQRLVEAVDVDALVRRFLGRLAIPAYGLIPPGLLGYEALRKPPSPPPLRSRPAEMIELTAVVNSVYEGPYLGILQELFNAFEQRGFRVTTVVEPKAEYYKPDETAEFDLVFQRWFADYPDADSFTHDVLHSEKGMVGRFCGSSEIDTLIEQGRGESKPELRHEVYREIEQIIAKRALLLPLFHELAYCFARPEIQGFELNFFAPIVAYEKLWVRE